MSVATRQSNLATKSDRRGSSSANWKFVDDGNRGEYADKMLFVSACYDAARLNSSYVYIAGNPLGEFSTAEAALDESLQILTSINDRMKQELKKSRDWNVAAAGRSEKIEAQIQRNWQLAKSLEDKVS